MTEEGSMETSKKKELKEKIGKRPVIIAISGPSGAGKDYLTQKATQHFLSEYNIPIFNVQMVTERPHRGEGETKICISPEEYTQLQENEELIGDHINKIRYGYRIRDIQDAINKAMENSGIVILELNPIEQKNFPSELINLLNVELCVWVGIQTTLEQTEENMKERGESEEIITERLAQMKEFIEAMKTNPYITMCDNGPENRKNSVADFINIIENAILNP